MQTFKIQTLNSIAVAGLDRFPRDHYEVASGIGEPDAILLRSFKMHDVAIPTAFSASAARGQARTTFRSRSSANAASRSSIRPGRTRTPSRSS